MAKDHLKISLELTKETTLGELRTFMSHVNHLSDESAIFTWDEDSLMLVGIMQS